MNDPTGNVGEARVEQAGAIERLARAAVAISGERARLLQAKEGGVGGLAGRLVLAGGLAQRRGRALDIQDVVDNLEGEADLFPILVDRRDQRERIGSLLRMLMHQPALPTETAA